MFYLCVESFARISQQTSNFPLYVINILLFRTMVESVYSAVGTDSSYKADNASLLPASSSSLSNRQRSSASIKIFSFPKIIYHTHFFNPVKAEVRWTTPRRVSYYRQHVRSITISTLKALML